MGTKGSSGAESGSLIGHKGGVGVAVSGQVAFLEASGAVAGDDRFRA